MVAVNKRRFRQLAAEKAGLFVPGFWLGVGFRYSFVMLLPILHHDDSKISASLVISRSQEGMLTVGRKEKGAHARSQSFSTQNFSKSWRRAGLFPWTWGTAIPGSTSRSPYRSSFIS